MKFRKMNKQTEHYLEIACTHGLKLLIECYENPSDKKRFAYSECLAQALRHKATNYGIITYNQQKFTYGYFYRNENIHKIFVVITPTKEYAVDLTEWENQKEKE